MADVRLTATNPEDSSVVPVACNAKGELLLEEMPDQSFDGNLQGDLTVSGTASFANGVITIGSDGRLNTTSFISADPPSGSDPNTVTVSQLTSAGVSIRRGNDNQVIGRWDRYGIRMSDDNFATNTFQLSSDGSATFADSIYFGLNFSTPEDLWTNDDTTKYGSFISPTGALVLSRVNDTSLIINQKGGYAVGSAVRILSNGENGIKLEATGEATFAGDVIVSSRSKLWMLVESNGLCHMVEQSRAATADLVEPAAYPPLRDVFAELDAIEKALGEVMDKLRMAPPAGWEVWDGSSENS